MKGTLEKLRRIFISKRRQEDDISASKFSRSLSFKKGSMRRSLRRLTRRKAVVTNHGIIYVEGDPNSPTTPTPPNFAAAFAFGQRAVPPAVTDQSATKAGEPSGGRGVACSGGMRPARDRSVTASGAADATYSSTSPSAGRAVCADANVRRASPSGSPVLLRRGVARLSPGGPTPAATSLASSTGNIPAGVARPKTRRPTDSLPRIPTEGDGAAGAQDSQRRASHCGAYKAVEAPHTPELAGRTARIMSISLTPTKAGSDAGSARSDTEDDARQVEGHAAVAGSRKVENRNAAKDKTTDHSTATREIDASRLADGGPQGTTGDAGGGAGGGARRRLPTVTATRDHLRRSLRRLSERRRRSRRPESVADAHTAGLDFYKMFSRVPPVLAPGTSVPSTPFTFSRRNPITQWLAESEQAQQAARKTPSAADWDTLLWSELVLTPPASEKEARRRAKKASKKAGRARRSGVRTSSEASAASGGTAASGPESGSAGRVEPEAIPQALRA